MVLVIDNYDSFTFNLVQYLLELGAKVDVVRNDKIDLEGIRARKPERLLISPGPCTPDEAGVSVAAIREFSGKFPILGVCLGHQSIGRAFGGTIVRASRVMHGKTSQLEHDGTGVFSGLPAPLEVGRYHSLVIQRATVPDDLRVTARCREDGEIMGVAHKKHPTAGVQFHPESVLTTAGKQLLRNFLEDRTC